LLRGVSITREKRMSKLVIPGDSMIINKEIKDGSMTSNNVFNIVLSCISLLLAEHNSKVDYWEKVGSHLGEGTFVKNGFRGFLLIPQ
jgi:hypothetical protein